ncbi:hypothetical protein F2Q69_00041334 [Brassica cretica]|uniref:Uncharacterized protein n=1 Tax=Brassica cretica TaxID=69181 RepID=A0A8S9NWG9_BRACR|nr:hypothetical protein F2Q69_00041334 [Brassica cretica]
MPKIDVARLNALRPKLKPSENPPETVRTPSDDGEDPMEEDRVPTGRTLTSRKEKVAKHLKRGANEKETREKEEDIKRMICEAREKMRMRITLKKKSDPGQFEYHARPSGSAGGAFAGIVHFLVKEGKPQEGDFKVESLRSFGGSHWCRSTPDFEHRSTHTSPNRSTGSPEHRLITSADSISCNALRILTHEEFTAKHPHPPNPDNVRIAQRDDTPMPKIDVARLNALRPKPKPSENPPETVMTPSDDGEDPTKEDRVPTGRTLKSGETSEEGGQ